MQKQSEEIKNLQEALAKAQGEFTPVPKHKTAKVRTRAGGEYTYRYADLADVLSMATPLLSKHALSFSQPHLIVDGQLRVCTKLMHASGEWMLSDGILIQESPDPQEFGKLATYYRRYDFCSMLGIAPDEDTDAQHEERPRTPQEVTAQIRQPERRSSGDDAAAQQMNQTVAQQTAAQQSMQQRKQLSAEISAFDLPSEAKVRIAKTLFPGHGSLDSLMVEDLKAFLVALRAEKRKTEEAAAPTPTQPEPQPSQSGAGVQIVDEMSADLEALFQSGAVKRASDLLDKKYKSKPVGKTLGQRLHILLNKSKIHTPEELKTEFLDALGIEHYSDIPEDIYPRICEWAEGAK